MSTSSVPNVIIKATNGAAFRKVKVSPTQPSWFDFSSRISRLFDQLPPIVVYYYDEDSDLVIVDSQDEFESLVDVAISRGNSLRVGVGDPNTATDTVLRNLSGASSASGVSLLRADSTASSVVGRPAGQTIQHPPTANLIGEDATVSRHASDANSADEGWERVDQTISSAAQEYPPPPPIPDEIPSTSMQVTVESVPSSPVQTTSAGEELPKYSEAMPPNYSSSGNAAPSAPPREQILIDTNDATHAQPQAADPMTIDANQAANRDEKNPTEENARDAPNQSPISSQDDTNGSRSVQQAVETLIATIQRILQQHPELYTQTTAVMNQIIDSLSQTSSDCMQTFQEWQRSFANASTGQNASGPSDPQGQKVNREQSPGAFPNVFAPAFMPFGRGDTDNDWRRGRMFGHGPRAGRCHSWTPKMWGFGQPRFGGGGCGSGRRCGNGGRSFGGSPWRSFYSPFAMEANQQAQASGNATRDIPENQKPQMPNQDHPGAFPGPLPQEVPKPTMDDKAVEENLNVVRNMGFQGRDEEIKDLIRRYGNLDRVIDVLLREN